MEDHRNEAKSSWNVSPPRSSTARGRTQHRKNRKEKLKTTNLKLGAKGTQHTARASATDLTPRQDAVMDAT